MLALGIESTLSKVSNEDAALQQNCSLPEIVYCAFETALGKMGEVTAAANTVTIFC